MATPQKSGAAGSKDSNITVLTTGGKKAGAKTGTKASTKKPATKAAATKKPAAKKGAGLKAVAGKAAAARKGANGAAGKASTATTKKTQAAKGSATAKDVTPPPAAAAAAAQPTPEEVKPARLRAQTRKLVQNLSKNTMDLAANLARIKFRQLYREWGPSGSDRYDSFEEYVAEELCFNHRKAAYLVSIHQTLVMEHAIDPARLEPIGWAKLKEIARVIDADTKERWLKYAEEHTLNDVTNEVNAELTRRRAQDPGSTAESKETFTARLTKSQKESVEKAIELGMEELGYESRGDALDAIALEFHSSQIDKGRTGLLAEQIARLERGHGVKVVAVKSLALFAEIEALVKSKQVD